MKIVLDCFGGDHSPQANVQGACLALERIDDLTLILTGDETAIRAELEKYPYDDARIEIVHAPEIVGCDEAPTDAIRLKRESSMMKAIRMLREDETVSGMVSTGSSGALVAAGTLRVGRVQNVIRPSFCPVLPTMNGGVVGVTDSGANVDCTPSQLLQFAVMGALYMNAVWGIEKPRVALVNVGTEAEKGDALHKAVYPYLSDVPVFDFVGNMESRDLLSGRYDLVVADGFSGNVLLKATEGTSLELLKKIKKDIMKSPIRKIGALFLSRMFREEKEFMNYQNYGGSVLLGTKKPIVKGHGSSNEIAVAKCVEQAYRMARENLTERIADSLASLRYPGEE